MLDWDGVRRERLRKNEQTFRDYNNRRVVFEEETADHELVPFVCECGDRTCIEAVELTVDEYTSAHSAPNLFTVKPEHVYPEIERVTETADRFWVVEKPLVGAVASSSPSQENSP